MTDPVERLVNLAITIASARAPVSAAQIRAQTGGYPSGQDDTAFMRMFERDKEDLRAAGLVIEVTRSGDVESYQLDEGATFAPALQLTPEEATLVRAAGVAMLADPSFPSAPELRLALSKLSAATDAPVALTGAAPVSALTADEAPEAQGAVVSRLLDAVASRKRVTLAYDSPGGGRRTRELEPYGLFARNGRWYLVARDPDADAVKVFAVARMSNVDVSSRRPKQRDFEVVEGFDVRAWMAFPFQFGRTREVARVRFTGTAARRAPALTAGQGRLEDGADGSVVWEVRVSDLAGLVTWTVESGPGIVVEAPDEARRLFAEGLSEVVSAHAS